MRSLHTPIPDMPKPWRSLALEFKGSAREYFRIWIVNLCLTLLTLGVFSAWAKVRKKRYFYSHTVLDGTPFQYLGQPLPILKGRVIAAAAFTAYYVSSHFFTVMLPYILLAGVVLAPWVIIRSAAFNARYSSFRNITFRFDGTYPAAVKATCAWVLIPILVFSLVVRSPGTYALTGAVVGLFGLLFPWWIRRLKRFLIGNMSYGSTNAEFSATSWQFYKVYLKAGLILIPAGIVAAILGGAMSAFPKDSQVLLVTNIGLMYAGYVLAYAYVKARTTNITWNHTRLGPLHFNSTLTAAWMMKLYLTNALAIIASFGLLTPWAVMRTLKYRADNLHVLFDGDLSGFRGAEGRSVQAAGSELGDFFDMDLSL